MRLFPHTPLEAGGVIAEEGILPDDVADTVGLAVQQFNSISSLTGEKRRLRAAMEECASLGTVTARSAVVATAPMGAARRRFANAALVLESELAPTALLAALKHMECAFGRRRGQRWGDRVLDGDIILWSGGRWRSADLAIPHPAFAARTFVLAPARMIAPLWRDPASGLSLAHSHARLTRPRPLPR